MININRDSFIKEIDVNRFKTQVKNGKTRELDHTIKNFFIPGSCQCENEVVKYKFLKLILKHVSYDPKLSKTMLFKFREVFGLPDKLPTKAFKETVTLICDEEESENEISSLTVSKEYLTMLLPYYKTMFSSGFEESHTNQVKPPLCRQALFAFKNYLYNQTIGNISLESIIELHAFADSINFPELFDLTKKLIFEFFTKSENTIFLNPEIIKFLKQHSKEFTKISLESMNIEIEASTTKNNRHFSINLTDFMTLFKNFDDRILNIWAKEISTLKINTTNFSLLGTIPKQYRRAITNLVNPNSLNLSIQDFGQLIFYFPNIYNFGKAFKSPTFEALFQKQKSDEFPSYWTELFKGVYCFQDKSLQKATEIDSTLPYAYCELGCIKFSNEGNLTHAATDFEEALKADPKCSEALSFYGKNLLYKKDGNIEENVTKGFAYLKKNIRINPKNTLGYLFLYKAYIKRGDLDGATRVLEKAIKYASENKSLIDDLINCYFKLGEHQKTINFFNDNNLDPKFNSNVFNNYCYALIMTGNLEKAEELLHKSTPPHLGCLITLRIKQNRLEEVSNIIKDIRSSYLDDLTHLVIGDYYVAVNDLKNALIHYTSLSILDPYDPDDETAPINKMNLNDTQSTIDFLRKMKEEEPIHRVALHSTLKKILEKLDPTIPDKMETTNDVSNNKRKRIEEIKKEKKTKSTKKHKTQREKESEAALNDKLKGKEKIEG